MNFICPVILFCFVSYYTNSVKLSIKYNLINWALRYYKSPSVVLIFDENDISSDKFTFLNLQKQLSSLNFYFSTLTTAKDSPKRLKTKRQEVKEMVAALDLNRNATGYLEKILKKNHATSHKWLLTTIAKLQDFETLSIPLDSEVILAQTSPPFGYTLMEIYDVQSGKKIINKIGNWVNGEHQWDLKIKQDLYKRRKNLNGVVIKVISPKADSCTEMSFATGVASIVWCIHQRVWEIMTEMLNATTEIQIIPELTPEAILNTDAELTFRSAPLNVVDMNTRSYVWPLFKAQVEVVASYMKQKVEWRTYVLPFSGQMWMVILIWVVSGDLILACIEFVLRRKKNHSFWRYCSDFSFLTMFTFCSQGIVGPSKSFSIRIIFLIMFITPSVLFPGYSAVLTSFLTVPLDRKPFRSLEELSRMKEYKLGWHNTFPLEHIFNLKDMSPLNQALLQNNVVSQEKLPATDAEAMERMCNEKFSYLTIMDTVLALNPKCKYYKLNEHFKVVFTSMEIKKNSFYKYFLDRCERIIDFTGVLYRVKLHVVIKYIRYFDKFVINTSDVPPIKIENIVLPFAALLLGMISSVVLLIMEMIFFKVKSVKRRHL